MPFNATTSDKDLSATSRFADAIFVRARLLSRPERIAEVEMEMDMAAGGMFVRCVNVENDGSVRVSKMLRETYSCE